jgi:bacteriorhodopsin
MTPQRKRLLLMLLTAGLILLIPFIAMQVSDEVKWTAFDFAIAGVLLFGTGLLCELVLRKVRRLEYRLALFVLLLGLLFLVWAELAVGIFGTPFAGS